MAKVKLWSGLRRLTDGAVTLDVAGATLREVLRGLGDQYPGLAPVLSGGASFSINGIIVSNLSTPLQDQDEVVLIQRIKGG